MALQIFQRCSSTSANLIYKNGRVSFLTSTLLPQKLLVTSSRGSKHYNQKYRRERGQKVLKIDLPDFDEKRRDAKLSAEELNAKMKEKGLPVFRPWNEKPMHMSCLGSIVDPYIPPEGDGKISLVSSPGMKQAYDSIGKKGKSYLALRKIRSSDYEFDVPTVAEKAKEIYIEAQNALIKKDEDKLHDLVTEKAYPEIMENVTNKVIRWKFIQTLEPPRIVHIRTQEMMTKDNIFAQFTLRLFSQQTLAVYDRFGRLMHGSEDIPRDVLEYIVYEKHISNPVSEWRIHGKIIPDWLPPKPPIQKTFVVPDIEKEFPEPPPKPVETSEVSTESRSDAIA